MPSTLVHAFENLKMSDRTGITFINNTGRERFLSYSALYGMAVRALGSLQRKGVMPGSAVLFQLEDNEQFIVLFWACLLGKIIPVPLMVGNQADHKLKVFNVLENLDDPHLVCEDADFGRLAHYAALNGREADLAKVAILQAKHLLEEDEPGTVMYAGEEDIAYVQYSSGSTGKPKGVVLTHRNLVTNVADISDRSAITTADAMLSWMPLTHDMGLICFHLTGVMNGINQYIMPTALFIRRPVLWIEKASEHKVSLLYSPNFGYQYFLASLKEEKPSWDLSGVRLIYNGAEPISFEVADRFLHTLSIYGLKHTAMNPGYGLAEASVAVTLPKVGTGLVAYYLQRSQLAPGNRIVELDEGQRENDAVCFVEVGYPIRNCEVRICGLDDELLQEGHIGQIQIKGDNVTGGYYNDTAATRQVFTRDGWLKTGDLGFFREGKLVVTGRLKNIIIINGQNYYPHDIERVAGQAAGILPGTIVACGDREENSGKDELILFILFKGPLQDLFPLVGEIRERMGEELGIWPDKIIPVRKIPKTTSGKVQHFKLLEQYREGLFESVLYEIEQLWQQDNRQWRDKEEITKQLLQIWEDTAGAPLEPEKSFFSAGINSIRLVQLAGRINKALKTVLTIGEIFANPDIHSLAACISRKLKKDITEIAPVPVRPYYSLSPNQERFFVFEKYHHIPGVYNIPQVYSLKGPVDLPALEKAITVLRRRHEVLRTVFTEVDGVSYQQAREGDTGILFEDLRQNASKYDRLTAVNEEEANIAFNLETGPLFRVKLVQLEDTDFACFFTIHHIIADGWSLGIVFRELAILYSAFSSGKEYTLPPLKVQYKDCVQWQLEQLKKDGERHKAYWQEELGNHVPVLHLPASRPRPSERTYNGKLLHFHIKREDTEKLIRSSQDNNATLFMTLVALLNITFYKYTGQTDIVMGTDSAGRDHPDLEAQVGCYSNTLPLRTTFQSANSFKEILANVKDKVIRAFDHQQYPFGQLLEDLHIGYDPSHSPLFDVLVLLQNFDDRRLRLAGDIACTSLLPAIATSFVDLQFEFIEEEDGISLDIRYNADLFDDLQITRLADHLIRIARLSSDDPDQPIARMDMLSAEERRELLETFNGPSTVTDHTYAGVMDAWQSQVEKSPDATAVTCGERSFTYGEMRRYVNCLTTQLLDKYAVDPGDRIGLMVRRDERMIVAILGILGAGAVYVPIDPDYPEERIAYMIRDSKMKLLLADEATVNGRKMPVTAAMLPDLLGVADSQPDAGRIPAAIPREAYVMYTSGSTGLPKGVLVGHQALLSYTFSFIDYFKISGTDIVIQQSSLSFDTSLEEIFPALCSGAGIIVMKDGGRNVEELVTAIEKQHATILSTTPLVLDELNKRLAGPAGLRAVISGGDILRPSQIDRLFGSVPLYNTYGPTETTVCALFHKIGQLSEAAVLGRPLNNKKVYIVDMDTALVPTGVIGEICIAGAGLAEGYLNREEETNEKFISNPFDVNGRLYRTGDLGKWLPDGRIAFAGRKDSQVKIRGYRVETAEVAAVLQRCNGIKEAVIDVVETDGGGKKMIAYYTSNTPQHTRSLRAQLAAQLPDYMVPATLVELPELPLLPNGKIDRNALGTIGNAITGSYCKARNAIEEKLVAIWENILERERIGVLDNFFELGGQSIKATRIIFHIRKELGVEIGLRDIFSCQTIELLAQHIDNITQTNFSAIQPAPEQVFYPLSHAQQRIWLLCQSGGNEKCYNLSWAYVLDGSLYQPALQEAIGAIAARHESLRTTFLTVAGVPRQKICPEAEVRVTYKDLRDEHDPMAAAAILAAEERVKHMDLEMGPLFSVSLFHIAEDKHVFLMTMHHIICDAWSMDLLAGELVTFYRHYKSGKEHSMPQPVLQYKDYTDWHNSMLAEAAVEHHRSYWTSKFNGEIPVLDLQTDHPRPAVRSFQGKRKYFELDSNTTAALYALSNASGVSLFTTLLALVKLLLFKYTGNGDIVTGVPVSGREHPDTASLVGCFINVLPIRTSISAGDCFQQLLQSVNADMLEAYEHQVYPFDRMIDDIDPQRLPGRSPLFDVMVTYRNAADAGNAIGNLDGIQVSEMPPADIMSEFDMAFDLIEGDGVVKVQLEYCTGLFREERIDRLIGHYRHLAGIVTADSTLSFTSISCLSEREKEQILSTFSNGGENTFEEGQLLQHMFEHQAALHPGRIAIKDDGKRLTYGELNEQSNKLAYFLRERYEVRPGDKVAVMVDRSAELIIALLGVLKSGAAYIPIAPDCPPDRLDLILSDSAPMLLLASEGVVQPRQAAVERVLVSGFLTGGSNRYPGTNPEVAVTPADLAYVIYTSGSSGVPKGVMITQRSLGNYVSGFIAYYKVAQEDIVIQQSSVAFDLAVEEIYPVLCSGGKLVIPGTGGTDTDMLVNNIHREKATFVSITPMIMNELNKADISRISSLRMIICGGDKLEPSNVDRLLGKLEIFNTYGPTECTVCATYNKVGSTGDVSLIGKPIVNARIYIADRYLNLQPIGIPGEICIGGAGVGRGYLNRAALSQERFIADPFEPGGRLYRTGDIGYWCEDGNIAFIGRQDDQVKIRGYRIELGEVEKRMQSYTGIESCVVTARTDASGDAYLAGYITGVGAGVIADLRHYLRQYLPEYMVPARIMVLDRLPLTVNGKVNRQQLPEPLSQAGDIAREAPRNEVESRLLRIWQEVLGYEEIGIRDNFFEIGGHSLKAARMLTRIAQELTTQIQLRSIFEHPTIAELSAVIRSGVQSEYQEIPRAADQPHYPLSHAQQRLWLLDQMDGESVAYNMVAAYTFKGELDIPALNKALTTLIERHESLRTRFTVAGGVPVQEIQPVSSSTFSINYTDIRDSRSSGDIEKAISRETVTPFDLKTGPLLRATLLHTDNREYVFIFNIHHIVSDGWSSGILVNELITLYNGYCRGLHDPLAPVRIQYKDYTMWQIGRLAGPQLLGARKYWMEQFQEKVPVLELKTDHPRPAIKTYNGHALKRVVSQQSINDLKLLARKQHATLFMVLLATVKALLYKYTGQEDIVIGAPVSGRDHKDLEGQVGFFVNSLALRTRFNGEHSFEALLEKVKSTTLNGYEHQAYPFNCLVEDLNETMSRSRSPLFDVMVMVESDDEHNVRMNEMYGITVSAHEIPSSTSKYDLTFSFIDTPGRTDLVIEYNKDLFKEASIIMFLERYQLLIKQAAADPRRSIREYETMLTEEQELKRPALDISFNLDVI